MLLYTLILILYQSSQLVQQIRIHHRLDTRDHIFWTNSFWITRIRFTHFFLHSCELGLQQVPLSLSSLPFFCFPSSLFDSLSLFFSSFFLSFSPSLTAFIFPFYSLPNRFSFVLPTSLLPGISIHMCQCNTNCFHGIKSLISLSSSSWQCQYLREDVRWICWSYGWRNKPATSSRTNTSFKRTVTARLTTCIFSHVSYLGL